MGQYIHVKNIRKDYIKDSQIVRALDIEELSLPQKGIVLVSGHSGSGKTTLLNLLGLLDKPTSGNIKIGDRNINSLNEEEKTELRRKLFGFVFQASNLIPTLTVKENLLLPLLPQRVSQKKINEIEGLLEKTGLLPRIKHFPSELSVGEQQRVALVRALVNDPKVILADEPTANLDPDNTNIILSLLGNIVTYSSILLIIAGNNIALPKAFNEPIMIKLKDGKVLNRDSDHLS